MLFRSETQANSGNMLADQNAARGGDARALGRLMAAHRDLIYALSYRILGNEHAAAAAAQAAARLAASHSAALPASEFDLWLLQWVVSACQARGQKNRAVTLDAHSGGSLQDSLCQLPLELRLPLVLVDVMGLDYDQAASVLGARREQVGGWVA